MSRASRVDAHESYFPTSVTQQHLGQRENSTRPRPLSSVDHLLEYSPRGIVNLAEQKKYKYLQGGKWIDLAFHSIEQAST